MGQRSFRKRKRKRNRKSHTSAQRCLPNLLREQRWLCGDCRKPVFRLAVILKYRSVIKQTDAAVSWMTPCGTTIKRLIATVDHLTPVWQGGSNHYKNLEATCFTCNQKRGRAVMPRLPKLPHNVNRIKVGFYTIPSKLNLFHGLDRSEYPKQGLWPKTT